MTRLLALLVLVTVVACSSDPSSPPAPVPAAAPTPAPVAQTDLTASLDALKADFNAHRGEARFLTLLSPS
jgi:hypothetical protein